VLIVRAEAVPDASVREVSRLRVASNTYVVTKPRPSWNLERLPLASYVRVSERVPIASEVFLSAPAMVENVYSRFVPNASIAWVVVVTPFGYVNV